MDDAYLINFLAYKFQNIGDQEKYIKWRDGAYAPMLISTNTAIAHEHYRIVHENPDYPLTFTLTLCRSLEDHLATGRSPEYAAYNKDIETTFGGRYERIWSTPYMLVKRLKNEALTYDKNKDYTPENAPVILLYGASLSPDEWDKYHNWFNDWGYPVYLPVLLKVPGVIEYSRWWLSNIRSRMPPKPNISEDPKYPQDLSIIYFENLKAYQNFEKSREFAAFNKTLAAEFPNGLNLKWNVVYRLTGRWTK